MQSNQLTMQQQYRNIARRGVRGIRRRLPHAVKSTATARAPKPSDDSRGANLVRLLLDQAVKTDDQHLIAPPAAVKLQHPSNAGPVLMDGLPVEYDAEAISQFWKVRRAELAARWGQFIKVLTPVLLKGAQGLASGTLRSDVNEQRALAASLVRALESLGPAFIKAGQSLSIRPDIVGAPAAEELARLQDAVKPFSADDAKNILREELKGLLGQGGENGYIVDASFATVGDLSFMETPVASASLAQVYRTTLKRSVVDAARRKAKERVLEHGREHAGTQDCDVEVAVKVQRPGLRINVSRDLLIMARAAAVYQRIARALTNDQTDYQAVLGAWGQGFWSELDFQREAVSQQFFRDELMPRVPGLYIPEVHHGLSSRRLLVTEWIDGTKLTDLLTVAEASESSLEEQRLATEERGQRHREPMMPLVRLGQAAFVTQLLETGRFHADPHPGSAYNCSSVCLD